MKAKVIDVTDIKKKREERKANVIQAGAYCSAKIGMILYYADPDALDFIVSQLLTLAQNLVNKYPDKEKYADFKAGKNPFVD